MGDAEVGAEREILVDGLDPGQASMVRASELDWPAFERHRSRIRLDGARDDLDQRALAGAVVAEKADHLAFADGEGGFLEGGERAVRFLRAAERAPDVPYGQKRWPSSIPIPTATT